VPEAVPASGGRRRVRERSPAAGAISGERRRSLEEPLAASRDRLSEELDFEAAARQHKQLEKIQQVLRLRDDLVREAGSLCGVAVTASVAAGSVQLWFVLGGGWQAPVRFGSRRWRARRSRSTTGCGRWWRPESAEAACARAAGAPGATGALVLLELARR